MKKIVSIIISITVAAGMFLAGRECNPRETGWATTRVDTLWTRDTLRDTVIVPVERYVVRIDTVWLRPIGNTTRRDSLEKKSPWAFPPPTADLVNGGHPDSVQAALPVERRVYTTADYRAVVEGFRPSLVEMELYRSTARITMETIRTPPFQRWSVGLQAGWGITPHGFAPYLGVGIKYRLSLQ